MRSTTEVLEEEKETLAVEDQAQAEFSPIHIVGSEKTVNIADWLLKLSTILLKNQNSNSTEQSSANYHSVRLSRSSDQPLVSVITSLYKGREYLESFLENITQQTLAQEDYEIIIINVAPSEGETELIEQYQQRFNNIQLINVEERIGIYNAWNLAIERSRGEFITNANVDDTRRHDCLEIQARHLLEKPEISVVYSDVFYTFLPNLSFELAAECNLKTNLPTVNKFNLLKYNSPHNAPMWRRSLHDQVGFFDTSFRSASDHDFWLRACLEGAKFYKIEDTLISYFFNPKGMSTQKDSPGEKEGQEITSFYKSIYSKQFFQGQENENSAFIPAEFFSTSLQAYETNFKVTDSHIFYGPYLKLPMGFYKVAFRFSTEGLGTQAVVSSITLDIAQSQRTVCVKKLDNSQREQIAEGKIELTFVNVDPNAEIEFRTHTSGRPFRGKLKFHGVRVERVSEDALVASE